MLIADLNLTRNHGGFISYKRVAGLLQLTCVLPLSIYSPAPAIKYQTTSNG